jgi:hypothetical protein
MRRHTVAITLVLALIAVSCGEPTSPSYTPVTPPPAGLPVSLRNVPPLGTASDAATITAAGDSVSAAAVMNAGSCGSRHTVAGEVGGVLVITVVDTVSGGMCSMVAIVGTFRAVVRPAPRGAYRVEYRARAVFSQGAPIERVLGRKSVQLP